MNMIDYNTKLTEVSFPLTGIEIRKIIVANAISFIGISAGNPLTYNKFEKLLGPVNGKWDLNRPFRVYKKNGKWITQGISTCSLVARSIWRRSGVDMPQIYNNYNLGKSMVEEQRFCRNVEPYGAWHTPRKNDGIVPLTGAYIIIGSGLSTHNITCIGYDGDKLISVDGGRTDHTGLQCIEKVSRDLTFKNGYPYIGSRKVIGWAEVDLLPFKNIVTAPFGWEDIEL